MDELHADLERWVVDQAVDAALGIEPPADAARANRLLWVLRQRVKEAAEVEALAAEERERIDAWRADRVSGISRVVESLTRALESWARAVHDENPRAKTQALPNGTLTLTEQTTPRTTITQADVLGVWTREQMVHNIASVLKLGGAFDDDPDEAVQLARDLLTMMLSWPYSTVDVRPSPSIIKQYAERGPLLSYDEEAQENHYAVVIDGEQVPGVEFVLPAHPRFNVKLNTREKETT